MIIMLKYANIYIILFDCFLNADIINIIVSNKIYVD